MLANFTQHALRLMNNGKLVEFPSKGELRLTNVSGVKHADIESCPAFTTPTYVFDEQVALEQIEKANVKKGSYIGVSMLLGQYLQANSNVLADYGVVGPNTDPKKVVRVSEEGPQKGQIDYVFELVVYRTAPKPKN